jgi:MinD-like ATPase involved in chromosome partitioning or flagellar assembly
MNKYDKRIGIKPEKVSENFKHKVKVVIPFEEKIVLPSINRGKPFMLDEKSKSITRSFISLTKAVRELFTNQEEKIAVEIPDKVRIGG